MMIWIKRVLLACLLFAVGLGLFFCYVLYKWTNSGPDLLDRYDTPLTYQEALNKAAIHFPLPPSCSEIHYGIYGDWQIYTELVRFKAPVEDCVKHVDTVIAWRNAQHQKTSSYPRKEVTHVEAPGAGWLEPAPWFDPQSITRGLYAGDDSSWSPQIWVDLDRGIFYFKSKG